MSALGYIVGFNRSQEFILLNLYLAFLPADSRPCTWYSCSPFHPHNHPMTSVMHAFAFAMAASVTTSSLLLRLPPKSLSPDLGEVTWLNYNSQKPPNRIALLVGESGSCSPQLTSPSVRIGMCLLSLKNLLPVMKAENTLDRRVLCLCFTQKLVRSVDYQSFLCYNPYLLNLSRYLCMYNLYLLKLHLCMCMVPCFPRK